MNRQQLETEFRAYCEQSQIDCDVFSDGPLNSEVVIIGEGPGENDVRQKKPFIGGSGALLWGTLRKYGLHRMNVYSTNVIKRQISLNRGNQKHSVHQDELEKWTGLLEWELKQLPNARILFLLGNYALTAVTGSHGITNWRGSVFERKLPNGKLGKVVCANNPAYALRELKQEPMFLMDCAKLDQVIRGVYREYNIDRLISPSYKEACAFLRDLQKTNSPVALDVEHPPSLGPETVCYGLANSAHRAMCINFRDHKQNRFTLGEEIEIFNQIQKLCDSHKIIAQNAAHETYWCWLKERVRIHPWFDTLLAHHTLYPQLPHSLQFLTAQYTTHPFYKDEGEDWKESGDFDMLWKYNCSDAAITWEVHRRELKELEDQGLSKFFFDHVMRAQPHLTEATVHGLAVDTNIKQQIIEMCSEDVAKLKADFHRIVQEMTDDPEYRPNPNSWQQLKELFFGRLRLQGRGQSTDKTNRQHMLKNAATPPLAKEMLAVLDRYSTEDKFLGTFAEARLSNDGRMRCDYKQYGVARAPGRLSSSSLIDKTGMNMQNQPQRARSMYVSDPDTVFIYFDSAQAEARIVAYRANIPKWKAQFEKARQDGQYDAHRALASEMFKVAYDQVPKADFLDHRGRNEKDPNCDHGSLRATIRYTAKRCRHGLNYRMERFRLSEVTGLPYHEASRAFALYHSITPELRQWWAQEEREFKRTRAVYNALGRRLKIIQRLDDEALESLIAFYPQSSLGDKIVQVWYQAQEDDKWPDMKHARVCLNVHDNLVGITTPKYALTCLAILKKYAESPMLISDAWHRKPEPLIIPAETKMSFPTIAEVNKEGRLTFREDPKGLHRWSHMKEVKL